MELTQAEKDKSRCLSGPDFLSRAFKTAFPDIRLDSVSAFLPRNQWEGKPRHLRENISKIYNIPYDRNSAPSKALTDKYKEVVKAGNLLLIDDTPDNITIFNSEAEEIRRDSNLKGIQVDKEDPNAKDHIEVLNQWISDKKHQLENKDNLSSEEEVSIVKNPPKEEAPKKENVVKNDPPKEVANESHYDTDSSSASDTEPDSNEDETPDPELREFKTLGDLEKALRNYEYATRIKAALVELSSQNKEGASEGLFKQMLSDMYVNKTLETPYRRLITVIDTILHAPSEAMRNTEVGEGFGLVFGGGHIPEAHCISRADPDSVLHALNVQLHKSKEEAKNDFEQRRTEVKDQEKAQKTEIAADLAKDLEKNPKLFDSMIKVIEQNEQKMKSQIAQRVYSRVAWERQNRVEGSLSHKERSARRKLLRKEMNDMLDKEGLTGQFERIKALPTDKERAEELAKLLRDSNLITPDVMKYYIGQVQDQLLRDNIFNVGDYSSRNHVLNRLIEHEKSIINEVPNTEMAKEAQKRLEIYQYLSMYNLDIDELGDVDFVEAKGGVGTLDQTYLDTINELHEILKQPESLSQHLLARPQPSKEQPKEPPTDQHKEPSNEQSIVLGDTKIKIQFAQLKIDDQKALVKLHEQYNAAMVKLEDLQNQLDESENVQDEVQNQVDEVAKKLDQIGTNLNNIEKTPQHIGAYVQKIENLQHELQMVESISITERIDLTIPQRKSANNKWGKKFSEGYESGSVMLHNGNISVDQFDRKSPHSVEVVVNGGRLTFFEYADRLEFKMPELGKDKDLCTKENIEMVYRAMASRACKKFEYINIPGNGAKSDELHKCVVEEAKAYNDWHGDGNRPSNIKMVSRTRSQLENQNNESTNQPRENNTQSIGLNYRNNNV